MRIAYISRLFSGIANGIEQGCWEPRGVPTVCRLLEKLDTSSHDLHIVFTIKDKNTDWPAKKISTLSVSGLNSPITVLPRLPLQISTSVRASGYLRELYHYTQIQKIIGHINPDLVYFDRVNIYAAALTSLKSNLPVVWRVMGIPPAMHDLLLDKGLISRITRLAYRAPFARVICSKDGSGGKQWMEKALAPNTPRSILLNGADQPEGRPLPDNISLLTKSEKKTKVLFVSRLVEHKGCLDFIRAACKVLSEFPNSFSFLVAGSGPYEQGMRELAHKSESGHNIHFLGSVLHQYIAPLHRECDIYVSLNEMSNLTNSNLEAMRSGLCIIMPSSPDFRSIDEDTDDLMPSNLAWRLPRTNRVDALANALVHLHNNPEDRQKRAQSIKARANEFIPSWEERIQAEITLLEKIVAECVK